jgi:hypothetical protein
MEPTHKEDAQTLSFGSMDTLASGLSQKEPFSLPLEIRRTLADSGVGSFINGSA